MGEREGREDRMSARGFKPVGWVAAVAGAAIGCYMLSLNVAAERAELASLERRIISTQQSIRTLQTELGTRGRLTQLEQWNAEVLALSAPTAGQFLQSEFTLARLDVREQGLDRAAKVQMASAEPETRHPVSSIPPPQMASAPIAAASSFGEQAQPLVRKASIVMEERPTRVEKPAPDIKPAAQEKKSTSLLDDRLIQEIGAAARAEKSVSGPGN
jgi:hypothetical protein